MNFMRGNAVFFGQYVRFMFVFLYFCLYGRECLTDDYRDISPRYFNQMWISP